jgi:hypothetical protein
LKGPVSLATSLILFGLSAFVNSSILIIDTNDDDEVVVFDSVPPPPRQTFEEMVEYHQASGAGQPAGDHDQEQPTPKLKKSNGQMIHHKWIITRTWWKGRPQPYRLSTDQLRE